VAESDHRIDAIETRSYRCPFDPPFHAAWDPEPRKALDLHIVIVRSGDYEGVAGGKRPLGLDEYRSLFIGRDPFEIERHVQILDNLQFHAGRMWSLEVALWDLMGKITNEPIWRMLGGDDRQVPLYASTGHRMAGPDRVASVLCLREIGFTAAKLRFWSDDPQDDLEIARQVREAVGDDTALLVDANQGWRMPWDASPPWDFQTAAWVGQELDKLGVCWLEEPLHRHDYRGLAELRRDLELKIAGGEGNREFADFEEYIDHASLDVYQPDVAWTTGIYRAKQLAQRVATAGAIYTPHTWGDGLVLLANLHVAAACGNAPFVEFPYDPPFWPPEARDFMLTSPTEPIDGHVTLSDRPGLGAQIDWAALEPLRVA
jgi:L-alanine-DL-glutamate epimerase-like enolase superfamily enzyme